MQYVVPGKQRPGIAFSKNLFFGIVAGGNHRRVEIFMAGDELLIMEAMKMELTLRAPRAGRIEAVQAVAGDFVDADSVLVRLEAWE